MKERIVKIRKFLDYFNSFDKLNPEIYKEIYKYNFITSEESKKEEWYKQILEWIMYCINYYSNNTEKFDYKAFVNSNYPILSMNHDIKTKCFNPYVKTMIANTSNIRKMIIELVLDSFIDYFFQHKSFHENYRILIYDISLSEEELENNDVLKFFNYIRPLYVDSNYIPYIRDDNGFSFYEILKFLIPNFKSKTDGMIFTSIISNFTPPFYFIFNCIQFMSIETEYKDYILLNDRFYNTYRDSISLDELKDKCPEDMVSELSYYCNRCFNKIFEIENGVTII